jgi:UDP-glucose 4-epimerase
VINFAGLKAVGESVEHPLRYYDNNISTLTLYRVMAVHEVKTMIFSSSATVYGDPATVPVHEGFPLAPTNPYGGSNLMIEQILGDIFHADPGWKVAVLRYFNPVGAHESGLIGENPKGIPNNLMPYVSRVAAGSLECLNVFGDDYPTPDGTGVRDYIHVMDPAKGHVAAVKYFSAERSVDWRDDNRFSHVIVNLGSGHGYSVLEIVRAFEKVSCRPVNYRIAPRRPGDIATSYADSSLARRLFNWRTSRSLKDICRDAWQYIYLKHR